MQIVYAAFGNALFILGGVGLLLLALVAGAFPRQAPSERLPETSFHGSSWTSSGHEAVPVATWLEAGAGEAGEAPEDVAAEAEAADADAAAPEPAEEAAGEAPPAVMPAPGPALPPTRTPSPPVQPVTLPARLTQAPITRLVVPRIRLDAPVVPARMVRQFGATTWEVPAFRVGHGIHTAGAGEPGNGILLGHVSSISQGNVFRDLERVRVGDVVQVFSQEQGFDYVVAEVKRVPRTDLSVLEPTGGAAVTLLTCTGQWLPDLHDYSERIAVRATLVAAHPTPTATATPIPTASATPVPAAAPEEPPAQTGPADSSGPAAAVAATPPASAAPGPAATPEAPPAPAETATATPVASPTPTASPTTAPTATPTTAATATAIRTATATQTPSPSPTAPPPTKKA